MTSPLEVQIVDALNKRSGCIPGFRRNHAKGVVTGGKLLGFPRCVVGKAAIFSGARFPITVRFSDSTGIPEPSEGADGASRMAWR